LGKFRPPFPVKRGQPLRDIRATSSRGVMKKTATNMTVGAA